MVSDNKIIHPWLAITWGLFTTSFILWLFYEKMVFSQYFGKTSEYIMFALLLVGSGLGISFVSKFLHARFLAAIIFTSIMVVSIDWFSIIIFYCKASDLIIMLELHVGILPALLMEWTRRCVLSDDDGMVTSSVNSLISLVTSAALLLTAGLLSQIAYFWAIFLAFITTGAMAVTFIVLFWKSSASKAIDARATPDTTLFFRDLIIVVMIGVPGFTMLEPTTHSFPLLVFFSLSMVLFSIAYCILARIMNVKNALLVLEGVVFTIFLLKTISLMNSFNTLIIAGVPPFDFPAFVIGFATSYLWTRVYQVAQGISYPKAFPVPAAMKDTRNFSNKVVTSLFLFGIAGCCTFSTDLSYAADPSIIYPVGLIISVSGLSLWAISVWKLRKNMKKIRMQRGSRRPFVENGQVIEKS